MGNGEGRMGGGDGEARKGKQGAGKGRRGLGKGPKALKRRGARGTGEREVWNGERAISIGRML